MTKKKGKGKNNAGNKNEGNNKKKVTPTENKPKVADKTENVVAKVEEKPQEHLVKKKKISGGDPSDKEQTSTDVAVPIKETIENQKSQTEEEVKDGSKMEHEPIVENVEKMETEEQVEDDWEQHLTKNLTIESKNDKRKGGSDKKDKAPVENWRAESNQKASVSGSGDGKKLEQNVKTPKDNSRQSNPSISKKDQDKKDMQAEQLFKKFETEMGKKKIEYKKVIEIEQDLFKMPEEYSLAHCVAEDMNMGAGIAVQFRSKFKRVPELLDQRQKQGGLAILEDGKRFIYYLVTKRESSRKPTYHTLFRSLIKLREHMRRYEIKKLAIPRIGCGLDRLEWSDTKYMLELIFEEEDVEIIVCNFQQDESEAPSRVTNCRVEHEDYPIEQIEQGTIIIYLSTVDGKVSPEMDKLDRKFLFLREFRNSRKEMGQAIKYKPNANYILYGCIVRKTEKDMINFVALNSCLVQILKDNNKEKFEYVGFQAIDDKKDDLINTKIINILRNTLRWVQIHICYPGDLSKYKPAPRY